jgi:two-component system sensor histidine kinase ChvG
MSESSRMERSITTAEPEDVDLRDVVRGCADAYRALIGAPARLRVARCTAAPCIARPS